MLLVLWFIETFLQQEISSVLIVENRLMSMTIMQDTKEIIGRRFILCVVLVTTKESIDEVLILVESL
jgi:hypothetical protein